MIQLPVLELSDGRQISQSSAISEFLAKRFNLVGENDFDEARCTEISDAMRDVRQGISWHLEHKEHLALIACAILSQNGESITWHETGTDKMKCEEFSLKI